MKFTPSLGRRLSVRIASLRSSGSPQTPGAVRRMAPKPRRKTGVVPPIRKVPDLAACGGRAALERIAAAGKSGIERLRFQGGRLGRYRHQIGRKPGIKSIVGQILMTPMQPNGRMSV